MAFLREGFFLLRIKGRYAEKTFCVERHPQVHWDQRLGVPNRVGGDCLSLGGLGVWRLGTKRKLE